MANTNVKENINVITGVTLSYAKRLAEISDISLEKILALGKEEIDWLMGLASCMLDEADTVYFIEKAVENHENENDKEKC